MTITINQFVQLNFLQPGDVIKAKKDYGLFDHFIVYLGFTGFEHRFVANMEERGVDYLDSHELAQLAKTYKPVEIRKFIGSEWARREAVCRAVRAMRREAYHLLMNNCEHLANYVQKGIAHSSQAKTAGIGLATAGTLVAANAKNDWAKLFGVIAAIAGAVITINELANEDVI